MVDQSFRLLAGECSVRFVTDGDATPRDDRGRVVVLAKPDGTVLVHDAGGYRPSAWLTRADAVSWDESGGGPTLTAVEGGRRLEVTCHEPYANGSYPASPAGTLVGTCPDCGAPLVRAAGELGCLGCDRRHGLPRDAELAEEPCGTCGLPRMTVERGAAFTVCVDRGCEPLDDAVRARFDRAWTCPDCAGDLRIIRRGGLLAGCEQYPDCEVAFAIPAGTVDGDCPACGLPRFATVSGHRCLDAACPGG